LLRIQIPKVAATFRIAVNMQKIFSRGRTAELMSRAGVPQEGGSVSFDVTIACISRRDRTFVAVVAIGTIVWALVGTAAAAAISRRRALQAASLGLAMSAALLVTLAAAGCARERDMLGNPIDGTHRVSVFAVLDASGQSLWKFSTRPPGIRSAEHVEYGEVPAGFTQEAPAGGAPPRPFNVSERLTVVIVTPEYVYRGACSAAGPSKPNCESWESAAPAGTTIDRALHGEHIGKGS
jgi:hypothetical protein